MPPSKSGSAKRDFGFVHFAERSSALKAVSNSEIHEIDGIFKLVTGQKLEVALAKPQADKKFDGSPSHAGVHSHVPPQAGFGANLYGSVGVGYGTAPAMQSGTNALWHANGSNDAPRWPNRLCPTAARHANASSS
ncbi:hypothetical protein QQ045_013194 [Rhodiola kirilowii]